MTPANLRSFWSRPAGAAELLRLAWPLIVSSSFHTVQIVVDRSLLAQHSSDEVGAAMAAVLMFWTPFALLQFTANYVSTFVAQYVGAGRPRRVGPAVGQSLYFSLFAGLAFMALVAPLSTQLIALGGHEPRLQKVEAEYLYCLAFAALPMLLTYSAQSFFTGRGESGVILVVNGLGLAVNASTCFLLINGYWGFPNLGIAGAGWAMVFGSTASAVLALALMLRPRYRAEFATDEIFRFEPALFRRLMYFGLPNGAMVAIDALAFTLFTFLVGRLGPTELAATSVGFTLNTLAFLPPMGIAMAVEILVGQRLGADEPELAERTARTGMVLALVYMAGAVAGYTLLPDLLLVPFGNDRPEWPAVAALVKGLLWFIAAYSLFDAINLVASFALRGAGDTRFVMWAAFGLSWPLMVLPTAFVTGFADGLAPATRLYLAWSFASLFIATLAAVFYLRFRHGAWKSMRVIEHAVPADDEDASAVCREPMGVP
jgi:MATE family multidrug resistance protein